MDTRSLLDQLLKAAPGLLGHAKPGDQRSQRKSTGPQGGLGGLLSGAAGGALGAKVLGHLLGSKKSRKFGGKALTYGGLAALGVMAWKAYDNWQRSSSATSQAEPQTIDRLPASQAEQHSYAILRALIAAAKADGHIDERERQMIDDEVANLIRDSQLQAWIDRELNQPLDPAAIAREAKTPEMAAEMYLASRMMVDEQNFMERAYLDELVRLMGIAPGLRAELDRQIEEA